MTQIVFKSFIKWAVNTVPIFCLWLWITMLHVSTTYQRPLMVQTHILYCFKSTRYFRADEWGRWINPVKGGGLIPSREARKKRRGSRFRYSSKKDLERSKLKRAAKTRASELASITKALSYPRAQSSGGVSGSGGPLCLQGVKEQDGDEVDLRQCSYIGEGECPV
jgi:hypothetical protein